MNQNETLLPHTLRRPVPDINPLGQAAMEFALRGNHDEQLKETSKETNLDWQRGFCHIHPFLNVIGVE